MYGDRKTCRTHVLLSKAVPSGIRWSASAATVEIDISSNASNTAGPRPNSRANGLYPNDACRHGATGEHAPSAFPSPSPWKKAASLHAQTIFRRKVGVSGHNGNLHTLGWFNVQFLTLCRISYPKIFVIFDALSEILKPRLTGEFRSSPRRISFS